MNNDYKIDRATRIKTRAEMYIAGEITLDELYEFEKENEVEDRFELHRQQIHDELEALQARDRAEAEQEQEPEKAATAPYPPELDRLTKEQFMEMPVYRQSEYYKAAPDKVREILERRPAYMDIIDPRPQPKDYKGTTLEDFRRMSLKDLNDLYREDPELYKSLNEQRAKK